MAKQKAVGMTSSKRPRTTSRKKKVRVKSESFGAVMRGYRRSLGLGAFADAGRAPKISDVEVVICFADLRGFTQYVHELQKNGQDNKVQNFLHAYYDVYPKAVLRAIWSFEPDYIDQEKTERDAEIQRLLIPTSYKNLGDGMMLIWELQGATRMDTQGLATRYICRIIEDVQDNFRELVSKPGDVEIDSYSRHAQNLRLGFGVAKGHAWRLDFGHHIPVDYAGSIANMASRLQGLARPEGIVAQLSFSESRFREIAGKGNGKILSIPSPKGLGVDPIDIWISKEVVLPKKVATSD